MPFKSEKQRKYLWAKHPEIAKKWQEKYGSLLYKVAYGYNVNVGPRRGQGAASVRIPNKDVVNSSGVDKEKKALYGGGAGTSLTPKFKGAVPMIKDQGKTTTVFKNKDAIPKIATLSDLYKKREAMIAANVPLQTHEVQGGTRPSGPTAKLIGQV